MYVCSSRSAVDTENMNPDDVLDSIRKMSAPDLQSLSVIDRQKTYDPNHYQDDMVCVNIISLHGSAELL